MLSNEPMNSEDEAPSQDTDSASESIESPQDDSQETGEEQPDLRSLVESTNIASQMEDEELEELSKQVREGFEEDLRSRADWEDNLAEWQKLALQVKETKTFPWAGASNVKYPLLSIASMQFNARAYPSLVPATSDIVKVEVIGKDADGQKLEKAKRIGTYMSYQILNQMNDWEEDMDRLLIMLPIIGTVFKKTYYDSVSRQNVSELVLPKNLVVNYWAKNLDCAERVSEILEMSKRIIKEKQMSGLFLDVELGTPALDTTMTKSDKPVPAVDETTPYCIIEQHCYFDMDDDGYDEPYIVTFERYSGKVLRVVARFDNKCIKTIADKKTGKPKLAKIEAIQYYTKFGFIPNPEGGFYDIGFGLLLGPLNESVNTLINQIIDAGTLNNLNGGFLGKGLKLKMGESSWKPGEWKSVNTTSEDLRKQIVPLPSKEPSKILFELMMNLITGAKELASVAEIMVGKMPGQNTPATTTMATIEQGMKVFTAVYKRVYRSLRSEFKKIFALNSTYLDEAKYAAIVDVQVSADDFSSEDYDVCPGADPNTATATEKLMKAQGLMELLPTGILDPVKVVTRVLEAQEQPSYEELFTQQVQQTGQPPAPPPDPKVLALQAKSQADQQAAEQDSRHKEIQSQLDQRDRQFQLMMDASQKQQDERHQAVMGALKERATLATDQARLVSAQQQHVQNMQHTEQTHQVSMAQKREQIKLQQQQSNSSKTGKTTR